jgi:hypothetical protein
MNIISRKIRLIHAALQRARILNPLYLSGAISRFAALSLYMADF